MHFPRGFGPFELLERVGVGGMAEVFRATAFGASGFEKTVALKVLREEHVGDPTFERMFLDEARLQASLTYSGLVQAHDVGAVDGRPWVRLDWVDGGDVSALRGDSKVPEAHSRFIVARLLTTLAFVHRASDERGRPLGLVHRDVSAANVLLSRAGEVKLGDFGIAKATMQRDRTSGGVRKGAWAYMSPEQVSGRPLTFASDLFSTGVLFTELLTGARPFDGADPLDTMERIRGAAPRLDGLPEALVPLVTSMLDKAPTDRPSDLIALAAALRHGASDERELAGWVAARRGSLLPAQGLPHG